MADVKFSEFPEAEVPLDGTDYVVGLQQRSTESGESNVKMTVDDIATYVLSQSSETGGGGGSDASAITYTPADNADWGGSDPGNVDDALDYLAANAGGGGSGAFDYTYVPAGAITPSVTGGCQSLTTIASASNQPDIQTLNFDATTQEYAQFSLVPPGNWSAGTVTFEPVWSHPSTTTNFGVVWDLQAVAVSNDDTILANYGTAQTSTDTGGTTDDLYTGPASSAITIAGTPAVGDMVFFRISRVTGNGSDTLAVDARLHGVRVHWA